MLYADEQATAGGLPLSEGDGDSPAQRGAGWMRGDGVCGIGGAQGVGRADMPASVD